MWSMSCNYQYATANNKYMRKHNKDKESEYLIYWDTAFTNEQCIKNYLLTILNGEKTH